MSLLERWTGPRPLRVPVGLIFAAALVGCGGSDGVTVAPPPAGNPPSSVRAPLTDMGSSTYLGFTGGLYPNGNIMPAQHHNDGLARANAVQPLDFAGNASPGGKYVLLSIGMSNTT